jgi:hypothetical protein
LVRSARSKGMALLVSEFGLNWARLSLKALLFASNDSASGSTCSRLLDRVVLFACTGEGDLGIGRGDGIELA